MTAGGGVVVGKGEEGRGGGEADGEPVLGGRTDDDSSRRSSNRGAAMAHRASGKRRAGLARGAIGMEMNSSGVNVPRLRERDGPACRRGRTRPGGHRPWSRGWIDGNRGLDVEQRSDPSQTTAWPTGGIWL